jgi:DNA-binding GntR family transcriptional regulator
LAIAKLLPAHWLYEWEPSRNGTGVRKRSQIGDSRSAHAFMNSLYAYHVELNGISGNYFVDMFYRRPYLIFYSRLLADYLPGGEWDQYIFNYSRIHTTILDGDRHAAAATFVSHMQWLVLLMRRQTSEKRQL